MDQLLFVSQVAPYVDGPAGVHGVLDQAAVAVAEIAEMHGLTAERVDDVRALPEDALDRARVLALFTIGETPWNPTQRSSILRLLRSGALSVVAIHSATDSCYGWDDYGRIVGARFEGHPWTATVDLEVVEPAHPATAHLGSTWQWHDEIYQFRDLRPDARILLRVPDGALDPDVPGASMGRIGHPLAWCFAEEQGRVISTSLGHFPHAWESPDYLRHLAGALAWALGEGD